ncbi:hypothetical protein PoB_005307100 [Plakobranchus ocellatus]|uniref:Uncharacterized protein n=1 Tax=Plakobranchus ocellatus TaxID=259542 RepID=A0AAV4C5D8_9GAST|nr:hypothetical protein PoB_005307100 [Plakobranchus ocellatus]
MLRQAAPGLKTVSKSPQKGNLRLSGLPSRQGTDGEARTRDRRFTVDPRQCVQTAGDIRSYRVKGCNTTPADLKGSSTSGCSFRLAVCFFIRHFCAVLVDTDADAKFGEGKTDASISEL